MSAANTLSRRPGGPPELAHPATAAITVLMLAAPALTAAPITDEGRAAAAAIGWGALALGLLFGALPRARPARASRAAALALGLLAVWTLVAVLWTESDERTVTELARTASLALFPVAAWLGVGPRNWRAAGWCVVWVCLALPAVAIVARLWPALVADLSPDLGAGLRRLSFPLGYWNAVGAVSAAAIGAGLALATAARGELRRTVAGAALPVAGLALFMTYSRAAMVFAVVVTAVVILAAPDRRRALLIAASAAAATAAATIPARSLDEIAIGTGGEGGWIVALLLAAGALACGLLSRSPRFAHRGAEPPVSAARWPPFAAVVAALALALVAAVVVSGPQPEASTPAVSEAEALLEGDPAVRLVQLDSHRYELWSSALDAFGSSPVHGIGPGSFSLWWARERGPGDEPVADAHSLPLETLAELGVVGLLLLAGFVAAMAAAAAAGRHALQGRGDPALWTALVAIGGVVIAASCADWLWESGVAFALGLAALAIAAAPAARSMRGSRRIGIARAGLIVLALAAFAVQAPVLVSESSEKEAVGALVRGDVLAAIAESDRAIDAAPWAAEPYAIRARARLAGGDAAGAREDLLVAIEREPGEPRWRELLAELEAAPAG